MGGRPPAASADNLPADWRTSIPARADELAVAWRSPEAWTGMTQAGSIDLPGRGVWRRRPRRARAARLGPRDGHGPALRGRARPPRRGARLRDDLRSAGRRRWSAAVRAPRARAPRRPPAPPHPRTGRPRPALVRFLESTCPPAQPGATAGELGGPAEGGEVALDVALAARIVSMLRWGPRRPASVRSSGGAVGVVAVKWRGPPSRWWPGRGRPPAGRGPDDVERRGRGRRPADLGNHPSASRPMRR